ncbi:uncharacterized protein TNCV_4788641 [Trichonephila clavipes]|nr:uncharacterized protein TNCV_4788641 [Trichonephila clavipes]
MTEVNRWFLEKINDVANLGKWSNAEKVTILKLKLAGIAEEFFLSDPTHSNLTEFNDIARVLISRFERTVPLSTLVENALEKSKQEAEKNEREAEIQLEKIKLSQIEKTIRIGEEKAFQIKSVPDELKAEILLNILGERVNNLLTYVSQEDLSNYVEIKELILREFETTPQERLSNFKKARKLPSENYVPFASRLSATFDYYCQLRKVNPLSG